LGVNEALKLANIGEKSCEEANWEVKKRPVKARNIFCWIFAKTKNKEVYECRIL